MTSPPPSSQSTQEERDKIENLLTGKKEEEKPENSSLLSKKQLKRQQKRQLALDERPAKRAAERARKKAKKNQAKNTPADQQQSTSQGKNAAPKKSVSIFPAVVAFDCRFDDKMSDKEIVSLDRQIAHSYSINRKANVQFQRLVCTSFNGRLRKRFQDNGNQYLRWKGVKFTDESIEEIAAKDHSHQADPTKPAEAGQSGVEDAGPTAASASSDPARLQEHKPSPRKTPTHRIEGDEGKDRTADLKSEETKKPPGKSTPDQPDQNMVPPEMLGPENVIYLSADSTNVLTELEPNKVYVIGSIVDHNRHKNLCLDLAGQHRFQHAQLPISEHFSELKTRKVLTVNQVFEILVNYLEDKDWKKAFERVIPARKL
ncbi:hypothetical protein PTTG_05446 [Puccinia triticina 1-1 BBBD Race 1]|uniref:tRNA (guanine(9)-N1)-methyltransferase n=2 Tax=Puccinia triticina TaxID=208348 RepID=A0A180GTU7_PUCT1|nr:uncharacterized protein PtA15_6A563 [Puccinia triticina]OAV95393.1 hypothetical protein PTTG_05446 [Puccinia triticina 1-1 BBBD Race 1]WAQ85934.1 hypothetical protein PtA15_6A563 [Puccinia triticina]WAR55829.1 hypothetical protein PtB15_6B572 [Puccinia triticina]